MILWTYTVFCCHLQSVIVTIWAVFWKDASTGFIAWSKSKSNQATKEWKNNKNLHVQPRWGLTILSTHGPASYKRLQASLLGLIAILTIEAYSDYCIIYKTYMLNFLFIFSCPVPIIFWLFLDSFLFYFQKSRSRHIVTHIKCFSSSGSYVLIITYQYKMEITHDGPRCNVCYKDTKTSILKLSFDPYINIQLKILLV